MSRLKLRSPFVLPPRGNPARLPALVVPVLLALAGLQLMLPAKVDLPPAGPAARVPPQPALPVPAPVVVPSLAATRALFTPVMSSAAKAAPPDPLGGAVIAGIVQQGRIRTAVVQLPGGRVRYLGIGGRVAGWRIAALSPSGTRLERGRERLELAYGAHPAPPARSDAANPEGQE